MKSLEPTHLKFVIRFDSLVDSGTYVREVLKLFKLYSPDSGKKNKKKVLKKSNFPQPAKFAEFWGLGTIPKGTASLEEKLDRILCRIHSLQERYFEIASPILSEYYDLHTLRQCAGKSNTSEFYHLLTSDNLTDKMEQLYGELQTVISELKSYDNFVNIPKEKINANILFSHQQNVSMWENESLFQGISDQLFSKLSFTETIKEFSSIYEENRPDLPGLTIKNNDSCPQCKENLVLFPDDSEKRCEKCGYIDSLPGTLFEDSQFYNQQIPCAKHKKHSFGVHCAKWLYQIQSKENKIIPPNAIEILNQRAIKEYTRMGTKRSMADMKCRQIRAWLKTANLAKLNNHAPLIRKIITGLNGDPVSPPQLSVEEEQKILSDFDAAIKAFDKLSKREEVLRIFNKSAIRNKLYYPFFLLKILIHKFKNDYRLYGLIECIHFQSTSTLTKDDLLWQKICTEMGGYTYEPTDRTMLVDIF
jgi:hypothetical protein